jgi:hypothetical protein
MHPLAKMLGTKRVLDFRLLGTLEYFHIHIERSWEKDPNLNAKFVSYASQTHSLEAT